MLYLYVSTHAHIFLLVSMCAFVPSSFTDLDAQHYYTQLAVTLAAIPTCALCMRGIKSHTSQFAAEAPMMY